MQSTKKPTVLVVDDEPDVRKLLRMTIGSENVTVVEARDGAEAVALAGSIHPDLILLDVYMPEMDGYEVCERLRADPATAHSHVIIVSTARREDDCQMAGMPCVDRYITKPFSPLDLLHVVNDTLHID